MAPIRLYGYCDRVTSAAPPRRIATLDIARGIAILGTLGTNIWIFTHPEGLVGYLERPVTEGTTALWAAVQHVAMALANGKFLGLLTLMFGIGLAIQYAGAQRAGRPWPGSYPVRAGLLFLDGLVNYVLIAEFDVLMGYAVTAVIVASLLVRSPAVQRAWAVALAALHVLLVGLVTAALLVDDGTDSASRLDPNPYRDGSFVDLALFRLENAGLFRAEPVFILALSVAMFLAGGWLYRRGVFDASGAVLRRRLMLAGAVVLPIDLAAQIFGGLAGVFAGRYLLAPVVAFGLLAAIAEVCIRRGDQGLIARALAKVGRVALSAYLLQNLVAGALFYGWGAGLAARLEPWRVPVTLAGYVVVCAVVVAFATLWLRRFPRGPAEWAWAWAYTRLTRRSQSQTREQGSPA